MDVGRLLGVGFDLAAEAVDVGVDRAGLDLDLVAPDATEQFTAAHDLPGPRREQSEQVELREREHHFLTIAEHLATSEVDRESRELEAIARLLLGRDLAAAKVRPDARHQLADFEGLGHVIVGAKLRPTTTSIVSL